jgi:hypothetical protein
MSRAAVCSAVAVFLLASAAHADDRAEAEELFERGRAAMDAKDFARACAFFESSLHKEDATGTLLNLALCHQATGRIATAWGELRAVEERSRAAKPSQTERADFAHDRAEELRPRLPRLRVHRVEPGVSLAVDGRAAAAPLLESGIPIDLGEHDLVATAPGKDPWRLKVRVTREAEVDDVSVPPLADAQAPPRATASGSQRTVGWMVGGVGVASIAVGSVFGAFALSKRSASRCPDPCTDASSAQSAYDKAIVDANVANVAIGVGIIAVAAGVFLVLTAKPSDPTPRVAVKF